MIGNFYEYWEVNLPAADQTFIAFDIPVQSRTNFEPYSKVDGTGSNVREIAITFSSNLIADVTLIIKGINEFGFLVEETIIGLSGTDEVISVGFYSMLAEINFPNPPVNYTMDVGYRYGFSPWFAGQYFRQSHQIILTSDATFTVYGTLTDDFLPTPTTTSAQFYPFPLSTALTNISSTILTPSVIEYPTGNVRIGLISGSGSLVWKAGNMMVL